MAHWFDDLPDVAGGQPLEAALLQHWPDRAMDGRLRHLRFCPVVAPELYQLARFLPVTVVEQPEGVMVMADLRPEILRRPAFAEDGSFQRSYRPQVTRLLPFAVTRAGGVIRLQDGLIQPEPDRPPELQQQISHMLAAQAAGVRMLTEAADLLLSEGLLLRQDEGPEWRPLPADQAEEARRAAGNLPARPSSFLALRLLAVLDFSHLHRQQHRPAQSDAESLSRLSGRNEALRRQTFLLQDDQLDFSQLLQPAPAADPAALVATDPAG